MSCVAGPLRRREDARRAGATWWPKALPSRRRLSPAPGGLETPRATLVTPRERTTCRCRRPGFHPWVRKVPSRALAWEGPWTEGPGGLLPTGSQSGTRLCHRTRAKGQSTNSNSPRDRRQPALRGETGFTLLALEKLQSPPELPHRHPPSLSRVIRRWTSVTFDGFI